MKTVAELWQQSQNHAEGIRLGYTTQQHYFAALVAAAERERIIKVIESMGTWAHINEVIDEIRGQA